jgi:dehydrogenase/reductase SDR family member 12
VDAPATRPAMVRVVDAAMEFAVVPSFSRIGFQVRRRLEQWGDPPSMSGRVALVTGATSGIGLAVATALIRLGAEVHLVGRDPNRGAAALRSVDRVGPGRAHLHLVDLSEPSAVAALADRFGSHTDRLDALVHSAGALNRDYKTTQEGVESTLATHVLGPYLLTAALAPLLFSSTPLSERGAKRPTTIVTVSSGGMYTQPFDLDSLESGPAGYDGAVTYARAKRAQLVLADAWATHFTPADVASYSMHPGWVDTPGLAEGLPRFHAFLRPLLRTPPEGADTAVWLVTGGPTAEAPEGTGPSTSGFFHDRRLRSDHRFPIIHPSGPADPDRLLKWCAIRTRIATPKPG